MSQEQIRPRQPLYTQIDVSPNAYPTAPQARGDVAEQTRLLRDLVAAQDRQNELLEELVAQLSALENSALPNLDNGNKPIRI